MDKNLFYFLIILMLFIFIGIPTGFCIYRIITTKEYNKRKNYSNIHNNINYKEEDALIHNV